MYRCWLIRVFGAFAVLVGAWTALPAQVGSALTISSDSVVLDPAKQKRIWDLEHTSFLIETYVGKPLVRDLRNRRQDRLLAFFVDGFEGRVLDPEGSRVVRAGVVTEHRRDAGTAAGRSVDAAAFVSHLVAGLRDFATIRGMRLAVTHIEPPEPGTGLWNTGLLLTALGADKAGGPVELLWKLDGAFRFADENEAKQGRIIARLGVESETLRTSPHRLMQEVTGEAGLADLPLLDNWDLPTRHLRTHRYQVAVADYDRDGYVDIAVASIDGRPLLLHSTRGDRFRDVTRSMGVKPSKDAPRQREINALVGWIDFDDDGFEDLLLGGRLYRNEAGRRFEDVTEASGLVFDRVPFGCVVADFDVDGRLDLYIVYQKGHARRPPGKRPWVGDPYAGAQNHLWRNEGGGKFSNVTAETHAGGGRHQTFAAAAFFHDADRFPDLYLANDFGQNVLLRNRGDGSFEDVTEKTGTGDFSTSMGVSAGDLDNDGTPEIYVANMYSKMGRRIIAHVAPEDYPPGIYEMIEGSLAGNRLYRMGENGHSFDELSDGLDVNQVGWAHAPAMVDLDGDGWLDLYATAGFNSADREKPDG